ncbi:hypothetical protein D9757_003782 [Collybiopsis confluens]|uniref:C2H2-type domain-containing protein n=1 Tax=Collybiopsis confluens TaxID=2823264 RepID=A0A8H5HVV5_9AGAR|nr:hypothetical protein D9757_003782 [Collybiopsis confluens]
MSSCWQQSKKLLHSLELPNFLMTLLLLLLTLPILVLSTVETRYIDDQLGDLITGAQPIYSPVTSWTQGATCSGCGFHPDPKLAFNHTWHDTTHHTTDPVPTVSFSFAGISVEVFCILPNPTDPVLTSTYNLTFTLDGLPIDTVYTHTSDLSTDYYYNTSVLRLDGLSQKSHTLTMSAASTVVNSTLQFDYATYMIDVASPSSSPSSTASSTLSLSDTLSSSSNALSSLDAPPSSIASSSSSPIQSSGSHLSSAAIAGATLHNAYPRPAIPFVPDLLGSMDSNDIPNPSDVLLDQGQDSKMAVSSSSPTATTTAKRTRPTPSKTFQCRGFGDCRMVFSRSEHLARHIRKHTGERPFTCHCGKNFSRLDNLRQHAQTVHADKAEMNERMMRELGRVHASMAAANKQAAQTTGNSTRGARGSQDGGNPNDRTRPARSRARPGTSTGYEGAGGPDAMYPGLAMPANQLSLTGYPELPDPYLVRKKEPRDDGGIYILSLSNPPSADPFFLVPIDGENGASGYSRESNSNGGFNRFHPHHPYNNYIHNTYNSSNSVTTSSPYPHRSSSTSGYCGPAVASSPSLSSSSSPSPVQDLDPSNSFGNSGGNFPYDHLGHLPLGSASASAPYLPLTPMPMAQSPVSEMPPQIVIESMNSMNALAASGRSLSSRTSHPHLNIHPMPHSPGAMHHPGSPFHSPPISASHSNSSTGSYFPLMATDSNERHHSLSTSSHHHHQHHSTSLPGTPYESSYPTTNSRYGNGYAHQPQPQRMPSQGYTTSAAWVAQAAADGSGGGGGLGGYWA